MRRMRLIAGVAGCAVLLRLLYMLETSTVPSLRHLIGDAAAYYAWAIRIAGGDWLGSEPFYQAPLYPYVLAVGFAVLGQGVWIVRGIQAVWSGIAIVCLWYGTRDVSEGKGALLGALMLALYSPAVFFDGVVQKASLVCLLVCALLAAMAAFRARGRCWSVLIGATLGLLVLSRENAMVWIPLVGVWVFVSVGRRSRRARMGILASYLAGLAVVLAPVGVRNRVVGGEWSISTFQSGPNFYIGNHRGADGRYQPLVRGHETPEFERRDARALAERDLGRRLSAKEVSDYWWSRAIDDIRADPRWWVGLAGRKLLMVFNRYEVSDAESQYVYEDFSVILRALGSVWHFGVLCPLAAAGVISTWRMWRRWWVYHAMIVSMALAVALFYVMARYRFPLVPLLIPLAAAGCMDAWHHLRSGNSRAFGAQLAAALLVAVVVNRPIYDEKRLNAMAWMNVGVALAQEGDAAGATTYFRRAVRGHPGSAEANNNLAQALAVQGDHAGAIRYYRAALAAEPGLVGVEYNLGVALEHAGREAEAVRHYERAAELDPSDIEAREAIRRLRGQLRGHERSGSLGDGE